MHDTVQGLIATWWFMYFAPSIVALIRRHHNQAAIVAVNVLLGWTIIGWIVAFVWACTANLRQFYQPPAGEPRVSRINGGGARMIGRAFDRLRPSAGRAGAIGKDAVQRALNGERL